LAPLELTELNSFGMRLLGWEKTLLTDIAAGTCEVFGTIKPWINTKCASVGLQLNISNVFTPKSVTLINGDVCTAGEWVVWVESNEHGRFNRIRSVAEIIQIAGSSAQRAGKADFVLLSRTIIGDVHPVYKMRSLQPILNEFQAVKIDVSPKLGSEL
jgi:hypothetical protein